MLSAIRLSSTDTFPTFVSLHQVYRLPPTGRGQNYFINPGTHNYIIFWTCIVYTIYTYLYKVAKTLTLRLADRLHYYNHQEVKIILFTYIMNSRIVLYTFLKMLKETSFPARIFYLTINTIYTAGTTRKNSLYDHFDLLTNTTRRVNKVSILR